MLGQRLVNVALELLTVRSDPKSLQLIGKRRIHRILLTICVRLSRESLRGVEKFFRAERNIRTKGRDVNTVPEREFRREMVIPAETCEGGLGATRPSAIDTADQYITADKPEVVISQE